jgi:hypothetical protein
VGAGKIAGLVSTVGRAKRSFQAAETVGAAAQATGALAVAAKAGTTPAAYAAGLASAAVGNVAFEKLRQSVNFEDDTASLIESAVLGTLLAAPFVHLNVREMGRLAKTADADHRTLSILKKVHDGEDLTQNDIDHIAFFQKAVDDVRKVETGDADPVSVNKRTFYVDASGTAAKGDFPDAITGRQKPIFVDSNGTASTVLPERAWLDTFKMELRASGDKLLDELFPSRGAQAKPKADSVLKELAKAERAAKVAAEDARIEALKTAKTAAERDRIHAEHLAQVAAEEAKKAARQADAEANWSAYKKKSAAQRRLWEAQGRPSAKREAAKTAKQAQYTKALEELLGRKNAELDELQASGKVDPAAAAVARQQAAKAAHDSRAEMTKASHEDIRNTPEEDGGPPPDMTQEELDAEITADGSGSEVFWKGKDGGMEGGVVVEVMANGKLKVDLHPELLSNEVLPSGTPRYKAIRPSQLDPDSLMYSPEPTPDGFVTVPHRGSELGETPNDGSQTRTFDAQDPRRAIVEQMRKAEHGSPEWQRLAEELDRLTQQRAAEKGFGPNTAGAAQVAGTNLPVADISPDFDNATNMAKYRFDLFNRLNQSTNPHVQELAHMLVKDAIGNSKEWAQRWTASERKRHYVRVLGGHFHWEAREAWDEVRKIRGLSLLRSGEQHKDFFEAVSRVVRGDTQILVDNPDIAQPLNRAANAMKYAYSEMSKALQKAGVEGSENIKPNDAYVNRVWSHTAIREAVAKHGSEDEVVNVIAGAIHQDVVDNFKKSPRYSMMSTNGPASDADVRQAKARSFLKTVRALEYSPTMQDVLLTSRDMGTLRKGLSQAGLTEHQMDDIVDMMFEAKASSADAGAPTNLRFRFNLNETHSITTAAGDLRLADLFENDSRLLVDFYLNSMAGHAALGERGITSRADFQKRLQDAADWHGQNAKDNTDASAFRAETQMLEDIYSNLTGRPMSMQGYNKIDRFLAAFRSYTRSVFLGQLGVASAFELKNTIGLAGFRAFSDQLPTFRGMIEAFRSGKIANKDLAQAIEAMVGFGQERASAYARQHEVSDFTYDRGLNRFENAANKASHIVDVISGNAHMTSATRQYSSLLMIQKHVNMATGKTSITPSMRERLVHQGVDSQDIDGLLADLKAHTTRGNRGQVLEIDYEGWQRDNPKTYENYQLVLTREVRDAIQEHDIGELPMWVHNSVAKLFTELRTFNIAGHAKQFLKGAHYRDSTTAITWSLSFIGEALAYSLQTSVNFAHNPDELQKRLSEERIVSAALQRMSVMGISSMLLETGYYVGSGGDSIFKHGGTANTDNRNMFLTPSFMAANRLVKGASTTIGALNPFSSNITTKQDMKDLLSIFPGGNTVGMRNLNDYLSSSFPKRELQMQR